MTDQTNPGINQDLDWNDEVRFWEDQLSGTGQYSDPYLDRFDLSKPGWAYRDDLEDLISALGIEAGRPARVLDVGSGPASVFSYGFFTGRFDLLAADPLAAEYLTLMKKYSLPQLCPMMNCFGEELARRLPRGHFDFVWSHNAIDHCQQPGLVLENMAEITRPGGVILVQCWQNEGSHAGWTGLHAFDFRKQTDGHFSFATRDGTKHPFQHPLLDLTEPLIDPLKNLPEREGKCWIAAWYRRR